MHDVKDVSNDFRTLHLKRIRVLMQIPPGERTAEDVAKLSESTTTICHFFRTLPAEMQEAICKCMRLELFAKQDVLFLQGDQGDKFYVLLSGKVEVLINEPGKKMERHSANPLQHSNLVITLASGDAFGEIALMRSEPRNASVVTRSKSEILSVSKTEFQEILERLYGTSLNDRIRFLHTLNIFRKTPTNRLLQLAHYLTQANLSAGTVVSPEKEQKLCFMVEGSCRIRRSVKDLSSDPAAAGGVLYDKDTISRLGPGNWFGESILFSDLKRDFMVEIERDTSVYQVSKSDAMKHIDLDVRNKMRDEALFKMSYYDGRNAGRQEQQSHGLLDSECSQESGIGEERTSGDNSIRSVGKISVQDRWRESVLSKNDVPEEGLERHLLEQLLALKTYTRDSFEGNVDRWTAEGVHCLGYDQAKLIAATPVRVAATPVTPFAPKTRRMNADPSGQANVKPQRVLSRSSCFDEFSKMNQKQRASTLQQAWVQLTSGGDSNLRIETPAYGSVCLKGASSRPETRKIVPRTPQDRRSCQLSPRTALFAVRAIRAMDVPQAPKQRVASGGRFLPLMSNYGIIPVKFSEPLQGHSGLMQARRHPTIQQEDFGRAG
ncbi:hypothetical protein CYMTET_11735 [Cymbomonas tetramitiformis]|uniref:Cyclic nucleotide-binding domain-containing protein n=1 Tax=Cymbomonas tetramitiformis TaxID=36881 RepID=A0AAE0GLF3_9CHLO|nr:hypothetical protein CYMTET_11735 [Cymbomonas tetramitiformis]